MNKTVLMTNPGGVVTGTIESVVIKLQDDVTQLRAHVITLQKIVADLLQENLTNLKEQQS